MESSARPLFDQITIVGLGLIGSSIARGARKQSLAGFIVGSDVSDTAMHYARSHGYVDSAVRDPSLAIVGSELIVLAVPPSALAAVASQIAPKLRPGTVVMDTASVKQPAIEALAPCLPRDVYFIPAHPVAGSERSGGSAGKDDLFQRRRVILTPGEPPPQDLLQRITEFWVRLGARVEAMPAELHDRIYAYVSHLPHLLAFAARPIVKQAAVDIESIAMQHFLRLGQSNAALWTEIIIANRRRVLEALDRYLAAVEQVTRELTSVELQDSYSFDATLARTVLFPRIASSCLVLAVMEAEKRAGTPFARFAGPGFADFTYPAGTPPDKDLEIISQQHQAVGGLLAEYTHRLREWRKLIAGDESMRLQHALSGV